MAYILDGIVILVVLVCVWQGWRKGFVKALSSLLAFILALVLSSALCGPVSQAVYDGAVGPKVQEALEAGFRNDALSSLSAKADAALAGMPEFVRNLLGNQGIGSGEQLVDAMGAADGAASLAEQIESTVVAPAVLSLLEVLVSFLLFLVISVVASLLLGLLDKTLCRLPILRQLNRGLGVIPGAVNGVLCVFILASVAPVWAAMGTVDSLITPAVLADTTLLNWLVSVNPLSETLQSLISVA